MISMGLPSSRVYGCAVNNHFDGVICGHRGLSMGSRDSLRGLPRRCWLARGRRLATQQRQNPSTPPGPFPRASSQRSHRSHHAIIRSRRCAKAHLLSLFSGSRSLLASVRRRRTEGTSFPGRDNHRDQWRHSILQSYVQRTQNFVRNFVRALNDILPKVRRARAMAQDAAFRLRKARQLSNTRAPARSLLPSWSCRANTSSGKSLTSFTGEPMSFCRTGAL
jgi:hypothetical protein